MIHVQKKDSLHLAAAWVVVPHTHQPHGVLACQHGVSACQHGVLACQHGDQASAYLCIVVTKE